jgi:Fe-Mn family superoxide dismutase
VHTHTAHTHSHTHKHTKRGFLQLKLVADLSLPAMATTSNATSAGGNTTSNAGTEGNSLPFKSEMVILVQIGFMENSLGGALRGGIVYGEEQASYLQLLVSKASTLGLETSCLGPNIVSTLTDDKTKGEHILLCGQAWLEQCSFFDANFMIAGQLAYQILRNRYHSSTGSSQDPDLPEVRLKNVLCGEYLKLDVATVEECITRLKADRTTCLSSLQTFLLAHADYLSARSAAYYDGGNKTRLLLSQENHVCLQLVYVGFYYGLLLLVLQTGQASTATRPDIRFGAVLLKKLESLSIPAEQLFTLAELQEQNADMADRLMNLYSLWGEQFNNLVEYIEFGFALSILQIYELDNNALLPLNPEDAVRIFCVEKLRIPEEAANAWLASCARAPNDIAYNVVFDWLKDHLSIGFTVSARYEQMSLDGRFKSIDSIRPTDMGNSLSINPRDGNPSLDDEAYREEADVIERRSSALSNQMSGGGHGKSRAKAALEAKTGTNTDASNNDDDDDDVDDEEDAPLVDGAIKFRQRSVAEVDLRKSALSFGRLSLLSLSRPSGALTFNTGRRLVSRDNDVIAYVAYPSITQMDEDEEEEFKDTDPTAVDSRRFCVFTAPLELPPLPYAYNALEPYIDEETMHIHHDKHHAKYVTNAQTIIANKYPHLQQTEGEGNNLLHFMREACKHKDEGLFNNIAQCYNHSFYWHCLRANNNANADNDNNSPASELRITGLLDASFGSFDNFRSEFVKAAMGTFGSGWAWLVWDQSTEKLKIVSTQGADNPLYAYTCNGTVATSQLVPLLVMDVWEHAYYLKYMNNRLQYAETFVDHLIDWEFVNDQLPSFHATVTASFPDLPFAYNALEPHIDEETMKIHHGRHHARYVANMKSLILNTAHQNADLKSIILHAHAHRETHENLFNNAAQCYNHSFYWKSIAPQTVTTETTTNGGIPASSSRIGGLIDSSFGSFDNFRTKFISTGISAFGSGWVWLVHDVTVDALVIYSTEGAGNPYTHPPTPDHTCVPLLVMDVWEHAYYLHYQNNRAKYEETFVDHLINWSFVESNLPRARRQAATAPRQIRRQTNVDSNAVNALNSGDSRTVPSTPGSAVTSHSATTPGSGTPSRNGVDDAAAAAAALAKEGILMKKARIRGMWSFMSYLVPRPWATRRIELHRTDKLLKYFDGEKFKDEINIAGYEARLVGKNATTAAANTATTAGNGANNSRTNSNESSGSRSAAANGQQQQQFALFDSNGVEVILFSAANRDDAEEWIGIMNEVAQA